jgi:pyridoxine 5-phosphate synthase
VVTFKDRVTDATRRLQDAGVIVSLFIDPDAAQVAAAADVGAEAVEFNTGRYSESGSAAEYTARLAEISSALAGAHAAGLATHAGHGLTYANVKPIAALDGMEELNIGHTIVSRSVFVGLERAVREMKDLIS